MSLKERIEQLEEKIKQLQSKKQSVNVRKGLLCRQIKCQFYNTDDDKYLPNGMIVKCRFNNELVGVFDDECPASKSGQFKKFGFFCNGCKERLSTCYAEFQPELERIDFHYDQPIKNKLGVYVKGCLCPSITKDNVLAFECACGNDTRDFREHRTHKYKEKETSKGRTWGKKDSKFNFKEIGE